MSILKSVTPLNLLSEKKHFFADTSYNPQFTYASNVAVEELSVWGLPQKNLYEHAHSMLLEHPPAKGQKPPTISRQEIETAIETFNSLYDLQPKLAIEFSESLPVRCKVDAHSIQFQLPIRYTHEKFEDLFRHELETHILRRINHQQQPWAKYVEPEVDIRRTEEGIANLHSHLFRKEKIMRKTYQSYCGVYLSQHHSFSEVFHALLQYRMSEDLAWSIAVRCKRGYTDTSQPGAFTKDICYLEGTLQVWQWLMDTANDLHDLYLGRISLDNIPKFKATSTDTTRYPSFFENSDEYLQHIQLIGEVNHFTKLVH